MHAGELCSRLQCMIACTCSMFWSNTSRSNAVQVYDMSSQSSQKQLMHSKQQLQLPFCIWSSPYRIEAHPTVADGSVPASQLCHQHRHTSNRLQKICWRLCHGHVSKHTCLASIKCEQNHRQMSYACTLGQRQAPADYA